MRPNLARAACAVAFACGCAAPRAAAQEPGRAPTRLDPVTVSGDRERCPDRDDPAARALWSAMRSRYDTLADTLSVWAEAHVASELVPAAGIGTFANAAPRADSLRPRLAQSWNVTTAVRDGARRLIQVARMPGTGEGVRGMAGRFRASWELRIAAEGYARPVRHQDLDPEPGYWEYPPLAAEMASHFASAAFGAGHVLAVASTADSTVLRFCGVPGARKRPYLRGTLVLRRDSTLLRATWRFVTPTPDDFAGGSVEFDAPAAGSRPPLLASRSIFYRRQSLAFYHRRLVFQRWHVGPRVALPDALAPSRPGDPVPVRSGTLRPPPAGSTAQNP